MSYADNSFGSLFGADSQFTVMHQYWSALKTNYYPFYALK